jgi:cytoskeleton protein RodZ
MNQAAEPVAVLDDKGPGRMLAQFRGERKLSVADVAQRLKYGTRQIEALEAEEFGKLPGTTFVRGMVRGYAKLLDVDPQPVLKALERRYVPGEISVDLRAKRVPFPEGGRRRRSTRTYLSLSLGALVAVAAILYEWHSGGLPWARIAAKTPTARPPRVQPPEPVRPAEKELPAATPTPAQALPQTTGQAPTTASAATPVPSAKPEAPAPQSLQPYQPLSFGGAGRIRLEVDSDSWVEIKEEDGRTLMSQLVPGGSRRVITGRPPLSVVIGNAAAVRLTYNDSPVDLKPYIKIEVARLTLD